MKSAEKRLDYDIFSEGAGFADLESALATGGATVAPALSPIASWTSTGILIQDTGVLWGDAAAWAVEAIWGADPLRGTGGVWSDPILWDDGLDATEDATPGAAPASTVGGGGGKKSKSAAILSIIWGGSDRGSATTSASSIIWGGNVTADSIVWGGSARSSFDSTIKGDNVPVAP